jgi:hypothetical protein
MEHSKNILKIRRIRKMSNFSKYNKTMTNAERTTMEVYNRKSRGESTTFEFPEPISGEYVAKIDKMYLTEQGGQLKFKITFQLLEGADEETQAYMESWPGKGLPKIPFTRPVSGTNNDASCIGSVIGWVSKFSDNIPVKFTGDYDELSDTIDAVFEESKAKDFAYLIQYNEGVFIRFTVLAILTSGEDDAENPGEDVQKNPDDAAVEAVTGEEQPANRNVITRSMQMPTSMPQPEENETDGLVGFIPIKDDDEEDLPF